jgi:hypothetical protein
MRLLLTMTHDNSANVGGSEQRSPTSEWSTMMQLLGELCRGVHERVALTIGGLPP